MIRDDIIEGPLNDEEPGTYLSNLVTNKKWDTSKDGTETCGRVLYSCLYVDNFMLFLDT